MTRPRLLLAAVAVLAIALPAAASDVTHEFFVNPFNGLVTNPCNGEVVQLTGTCRTRVFRWVDEDGSTRGTHKTSCHADGIGSFGNRYVMHETQFSSGDVPATCTAEEYPTEEQRDTALLVSQGSADNFWLRVRFQFLHPLCFQGPPEVIVEGETECRG